MDVVADRLHAAPARRARRRTATRRCPRAGRSRSSGCRAGRRAPRRAGPRPVLPGVGHDGVGRAGVLDDELGRDPSAGRPGPGCGCRRCRSRRGSRWRGSAGRTRSAAASTRSGTREGWTLSISSIGRRLRALVGDLVAGADPHRCVLQGSLLLVIGSPGPLRRRGMPGHGRRLVACGVLRVTLTSTVMPRLSEGKPVQVPDSGTAWRGSRAIGDADQVAVADDAVGRVELHPAGARAGRPGTRRGSSRRRTWPPVAAAGL